MRVLFINLIVVLVATVAIQVQGHYPIQPDEENKIRTHENNNNNNEIPFLDTNRGKEFLMLMNNHFAESLNYLYTSKQFGSQVMQRPGLAKYLSDASDREWEQGLDVLKKYMQRGGNVDGFREKIQINSKGEVNVNNPADKFNSYVRAFSTLRRDAKNRFKMMNRIHSRASRHLNGDAEIGHYLDKQQAKEAEHIYELMTYENMIKKMRSIGLAFNFFDSSL